MVRISAVINALNAQDYIERALGSVRWVDEIVVVDDGSSDDTVRIAKKYTNKIFHHKSLGYVEPARNFALDKATGDWVILLDTDEEIPQALAKELKKLAEGAKQIDYVEIPRKNLIFGRWIEGTFWWPDYHPRFFRRGKVIWRDEIHSKPKLEGLGLKLEPKEDFAIVHHNYDNLDQFVKRNFITYSKQQAKELIESGYKFEWSDLITKPLGEFLSRYFANEGYKDGLHGLALSLLQAVSFLLVYLRVWEEMGFKDKKIELAEFKDKSKSWAYEMNYWVDYTVKSKNLFVKVYRKIKQQIK